MAGPNYNAAKRARELKRKAKREAKLARKHARKNEQPAVLEGGAPAATDVALPADEPAEPS